MSTGTTAADYSRRYYSHYSDTDEKYEWDSPGWRRWFLMVARNALALTGPVRTALDVGCAQGLLVQALAHEGVDATGFDISPTAIEGAHEEVRNRIRLGSATEPIEDRYDLITCVEVLEHLSPADALIAVDNMCSATDLLLISSTPGDYDEPTHVNVHPLADWASALAARGFYRRIDADLSFMTPWAVLYERSDLTPRDIVHRYETMNYPMRLELLAKREQLLLAHRDLAKLENAEELAELRHQLMRHRDNAIGIEASMQASREQIDSLHGLVGALQRELEAVRTSERWRVGGAVLAPAQAVKRRRNR
jgi:hypothetical protein